MKKLSVFSYQFLVFSGQSLVELLLAIGLAAIILPVIVTGIIATNGGQSQQKERITAVSLLRESQEAVRSVRESGWSNLPASGTYHPVISGDSWTLATGSGTVGTFNREIVIDDVYRIDGVIASSGGTLDPSTKKFTYYVSWLLPRISTITATSYLTRYLDNLSYIQTTQADFTASTRVQVSVTNTAGGEVQLSDNNKAKWCEPAFSSASIDLPDGPPVAVDAKASTVSSSTPNDVFVGTSPYATSSVKLAHVNVTANTDPPTASLRGTFTLDSSRYSDPGLVPSGINIDNNFRTNDVKYYTSASGKTYALMATDLSGSEVVVAQIDDGTANGAFQDPTNNIYKYWTYFNTRIFNTNASQETDFTSPSANSVDTGGDGDGFASNPSRAYSTNNSYAVDTNSGSNTGTSCTGSDKDRHRYYNYGFSIPAGATINGIEVEVEAKADSQTGSPMVCIELSWDGGTTWTTAQSTSTLTTSDVTYTLGGEADTWGRSWSSTDFSNSNFRVRVINVASNTSRDFSIDWVPVNVHFSVDPADVNDQSPFDYGGTTLTVLNDRGYVASGGYLYVFDLANIDSKSTSEELDQLGCRIQLDGYECEPGNGTDRKYSAGQYGTTWSDTTSPAHNDCSDGGNIELYATNDLSGVTVSGSDYIFVAVGAGTNPEFNVVNATDIPDTGTSPTITNSNCGRISGGNAGWKRVGSYDFNTGSGTEEAANSVFAKSDGTRAYISSNGTTDSKQFYILNTSTKTSPAFLSGSSATGPTSGYYQGSGANGEMYPRRSMTVLNGQRVVLVGKDGVSNSNDAQEYQVLNSSTETTPSYCGGIDFNEGFNDLTYVTEYDYDNYVYMVANTTANELKIIQGGPDGQYLDQGSIESPTYDTSYSTAFNSFVSTLTKPTNTDVKFQFAVADAVSGSCSGSSFVFTGPDGSTGTYYTATESALLTDNDGTGYENPGRCFRYKAFLTTTDFNATPIFQDITINHSP